jgi:hypothetical protein
VRERLVGSHGRAEAERDVPVLVPEREVRVLGVQVVVHGAGEVRVHVAERERDVDAARVVLRRLRLAVLALAGERLVALLRERERDVSNLVDVRLDLEAGDAAVAEGLGGEREVAGLAEDVRGLGDLEEEEEEEEEVRFDRSTRGRAVGGKKLGRVRFGSFEP